MFDELRKKYSKKYLSQSQEIGYLLKLQDIQYNKVTEHFHLPQSVLLVLYSIVELGTPCTQKQICDDRLLGKQTVNAAINTLKKNNLIRLEASPDNAKFKHIYFTKKGEDYANKIVYPVMKAELDAAKVLSPSERTELIKIMGKYVSSMVQEFDKICM